MSDEIINPDPTTINIPPPPSQIHKFHTLEHPLSAQQRLAIHLLVHGKPDREVADTIKLDRSTITRWRLYHPTFRTQLNRQREALWLNQTDLLRSMMQDALHTLQTHLSSQSERSAFRAAVSIIRLALKIGPPSGPTDEYDLLKQHRLREISENKKHESEMTWPIPKEHLDILRNYFLKKSANLPLEP